LNPESSTENNYLLFSTLDNKTYKVSQASLFETSVIIVGINNRGKKVVLFIDYLKEKMVKINLQLKNV